MTWGEKSHSHTCENYKRESDNSAAKNNNTVILITREIITVNGERSPSYAIINSRFDFRFWRCVSSRSFRAEYFEKSPMRLSDFPVHENPKCWINMPKNHDECTAHESRKLLSFCRVSRVLINISKCMFCTFHDCPSGGTNSSYLSLSFQKLLRVLFRFKCRISQC